MSLHLEIMGTQRCRKTGTLADVGNGPCLGGKVCKYGKVAIEGQPCNERGKQRLGLGFYSLEWTWTSSTAARTDALVKIDAG